MALSYANLGIAFRNANDFESARRAFEKSIRADGDFTMGYVNLGLLNFVEGKDAEALNVFEAAAGRGLRSSDVVGSHIQMLIANGRIDDARVELQLEYQSDPALFGSLATAFRECERTHDWSRITASYRADIRKFFEGSSR
jgi:Flp pilus assembly protein TadD